MKHKLSFYSLEISFLLFLALAFALVFQKNTIQGDDYHLLGMLSRFDSTSATSFFKLITIISSPAIVTILALAIILLIRPFSLKKTILLMTYYLGTSALGVGLKYLFSRQRPNHQLLADTGYSFPSGHTLCILLLFFLLLYLLKKDIKSLTSLLILSLTAIFALLVILSRLYLRDHFPTDILASLLLSISAYSALLTLTPYIKD
ncbi:phosphatase PAP2 family protein [Streptococcus hongkongensis]|nr:hypothetical protein NC01_06985 [Streptococcus uberis]